MSEISEDTAGPLRAAVAAEHAALWVYGLANAFSSESRVRNAIEEAVAQHQRIRDTAEQAMHAGGVAPPSPQPAYNVGEAVTNQRSAITVLIKAETDCQVGWRAVIEATEDAALRAMAVDGLTTAATRATRWRLTIGTQPAVEPFPGQP